MNNSKVLAKDDKWAKILIQKLLWNNPTWWFDIDSLYCVNWNYIVIEILKCDNTPAFVSHPKFYLWKNWRKFISLWNLTQKLWWKLFLINYEFDENNLEVKDNFKLMEVKNLDISLIQELKYWERCEKCIETEDTKMNFKQLQEWYLSINKSSLNQ